MTKKKKEKEKETNFVLKNENDVSNVFNFLPILDLILLQFPL